MKTAECGRIKNLYEQRGPWHRSVSGCRKKDARLVVAKDEAHAAVDVDVDSADHDVLVGVASRAWELEPDDLTCAVLALVAGLIHERLPSPQLRHAEQDLDARSLRLEAVPDFELKIEPRFAVRLRCSQERQGAHLSGGRGHEGQGGVVEQELIQVEPVGRVWHLQRAIVLDTRDLVGQLKPQRLAELLALMLGQGITRIGGGGRLHWYHRRDRRDHRCMLRRRLLRRVLRR